MVRQRRDFISNKCGLPGTVSHVCRTAAEKELIILDKKKKIIIIVAVVIAVLIAAAVCCRMFIGRSDLPQAEGDVVTLDYASHTMLLEDKMVRKDINFGGGTVKLSGAYFDGIRLYLSIDPQDNFEGEIKEAGQFELVIGEEVYKADLLYEPHEVLVAGGKNEEEYLLVFNKAEKLDLSSFILRFNNDIATEKISLSGDTVKSVVLNTKHEEVILKNVKFASSCTVISCDISALIEARSFKFETSTGMIFPLYVLEKDGVHYELLIPLKLDESSTGNLISMNNWGNCELTVPIDFVANA